jgi:hypothetical protein
LLGWRNAVATWSLGSRETFLLEVGEQEIDRALDHRG